MKVSKTYKSIRKLEIGNRYTIIGNSFENWTGLGLPIVNSNAIVANTIENYCKSGNYQKVLKVFYSNFRIL
jgi:hypothetical protein